MTVTTTNVFNRYDGDGSTVVFAVTFEFRDTDELAVYRIGKTTQDWELQIEGFHYSVTGGGGSGGTVDFTLSSTAPASTEEVYIERASKGTQQIVYPAALALVEGIDRSRMFEQELRYGLGRVMKQPPGEGSRDMTLPSILARANGYLTFDENGQPTISAANDESATTVTVANSTTARTQAIRWGEIVNVKDWGAVANGLAFDGAAINDAIVRGNIAGGIVFFPAGTYLLEESIVVPTGVTLQGEGVGVTKLIIRPGVNAPVVIAENSAALLTTASQADARAIGVRNMTLDGNRASQTTADANTGITAYTDSILIENVEILACSRGLHLEYGGTYVETDDNLFSYINNVTIKGCEREGFYWNKAQHVRIGRLNVIDCSLQTDATYDAVRITGAASGSVEALDLYSTSSTVFPKIGLNCDATNVVTFGGACKVQNADTLVELAGARHLLGSGFQMGAGTGAVTTVNLSVKAQFGGNNVVMSGPKGGFAAAKGIVFDDSAGAAICSGTMATDFTFIQCHAGVVDFNAMTGTDVITLTGRSVSTDAASVNYIGVDGLADGTLPAPVPGTNGSLHIDIRQRGSKLFDIITSNGFRVVASVAGTIAVLHTDKVVSLTGVLSVTGITGGIREQSIKFITSSTAGFTDGAGMILNQVAGNFVGTTGSVIELVFDGTNWFEATRSLNN